MKPACPASPAGGRRGRPVRRGGSLVKFTCMLSAFPVSTSETPVCRTGRLAPAGEIQVDVYGSSGPALHSTTDL
ncbi:MAG: hypothetical protein KAI99_11515 [Cyclobacteriaceae bacterium]|nr:hypothetical protein [Cyclobacteriaceae bacterium]